MMMEYEDKGLTMLYLMISFGAGVIFCYIIQNYFC